MRFVAVGTTVACSMVLLHLSPETSVTHTSDRACGGRGRALLAVDADLEIRPPIPSYRFARERVEADIAESAGSGSGQVTDTNPDELRPVARTRTARTSHRDLPRPPLTTVFPACHAGGRGVLLTPSPGQHRGQHRSHCKHRSHRWLR